MASKTTKPKPSYAKDLILLFAVPTAIALLAFVLTYVPRLMANPSYDFIYSHSYCHRLYCDIEYTVDAGGRLNRDIREGKYDSSNPSQASLWYYDTSADSSTRLSLEESRKYELEPSSRSPDGYALINAASESSSGFLIWRSYDDGWYLKKGFRKKPISFLNSGMGYSNQIKFLGWVEK